MLTSVVTNFANSVRASQTRGYCRCVQHRHPERPTGVEGSPSNRKSGIRNPHNRCIFSPFHFSNRKYFAVLHPAFSPSTVLPPAQRSGHACHLSLATRQCPPNRDTGIRNSCKPRHFNRFQFSNRDKNALLHPEGISGSSSLPPCLFVSLPPSPCLRASVANLCDNVRLN